MLTQIQFAFDITGPILIILLSGIMLRRLGLINEAFVKTGNALVFSFTLPLMLFFSLAEPPANSTLDISVVIYGLLATLVIVLLLVFLGKYLVVDEKRGVFVQGAFRGNMGIIGIALVLNAYGPNALPQAAFYVGVLTVLYNILSVWILGEKGDAHWQRILRNPLIIGIFFGFLLSVSGLTIPHFVTKGGAYISDLTLPLALLCIGGSLQWSSFKANHRDVLFAVIAKLILIPLIIVIVAVIAGFRGELLGILFFMMAAPTAAASYVMARQMTIHGLMAAEIVAVTTVLSPFTITVGLLALNAFTLI